jgi:glycosyltransferase involved in cell wall biosynthesis
MVIVYVLTSLSMGGAEKQVLALAERMADKGHAVKVQWPVRLPIFHLNMARTPWSVLSGCWRARRFLRRVQPDVLHGHSFHANIVARLLKILNRGPLVVSTVHNVYEGGLHRMVLYRLTDLLCVRTTAVSEAARARFVRMRAVPKDKCVVVTNGIDTEEFAPDADRRVQMRAHMGVAGEFVWLTAGRLVPAKDLPNLLRAFAQVWVAMPDAKLWIAGNGDVEAVRRASGLDPDSGMWAQVRWLGLRRDVAALMDGADGFVLASAWEGMPLVLGEAMAMEKPVVATDAGGVHELVGSAGTVVPVKDSGALAQSMLDTMRMGSLDRQRLGRTARARIASEFAMDSKADEWDAIYRSVLRAT